MNNCCKFELRKAMQAQTDVAITIGMALAFIEALWMSQFVMNHSGQGAHCRHCKEPVKSGNVIHTAECPFVAVWNGEEMTYLRYSLDIKHNVQVK